MFMSHQAFATTRPSVVPAYPAAVQNQTVRVFGAITAIVTDFRADGSFAVDLRSELASLSFAAETVGGPLHIRVAGVDRAARDDHAFSYIPAATAAVAHGSDIVYARHLLLQFRPDELAALAGDSLDLSALGHLRVGFGDPRLARLCRMFIDEALSPPDASRLYMDGLSTALISRLVETDDAVTATQGGLAPWQLRRIMDHFSARIADDVSMDELAAVVQLSRSYFCRVFKSTTGVTPHQWQLNARIALAKTLILRDDIPLARVALEVGFSDQAHFTRVFRKAEGISPGQWMRARRGQVRAACPAAEYA